MNMNNLQVTNSLLILMCILSTISLFVLFNSRVTEEDVVRISTEVTVGILDGYEFEIVE